MSEPFLHPILFRGDRTSTSCGIYDVTAEKPEECLHLLQGSTHGLCEVFDSLEEFYERLAKDRKLRESLGIPPMNYLAYSFPAWEYDVAKVIQRKWHVGNLRRYLRPDRRFGLGFV